MCRGSVHAVQQEDAKVGVDYHISSTAYHGGNHRHGVLHEAGKGHVAAPGLDPGARVVACAACIQVPTTVQLTAIPHALQQKYGLTETETALFLSGDDEADGQDKVEFGSGQKVDLYDLADVGITLMIPAVTTTKTVPAEAAPERVLEVA